MLTSLATREIQNQTMRKYYYPLIRRAFKKKKETNPENTKGWQEYRISAKFSYIASENAKWNNHSGKHVSVSYKLNTHLPYVPFLSLQDTYRPEK